MQFPHVCPLCDLPLMLYVSTVRNEDLCAEFKEATSQEFLLLKVKDIIAEYTLLKSEGTVMLAGDIFFFSSRCPQTTV